MKKTSVALLLTTLMFGSVARADNLDNIINDTINSVTQALNQQGDDEQAYEDNDDGQWREALSDNERQRYNDQRRQLDERRRQLNEQQRQLDEQRRELNDEERRLDNGG